MKSIFTFLLLASFSILSAQDVALNTYEVELMAGDSIHSGDIVITNNTASEMIFDTRLERICLSGGDETKLQICFGDLCFISTNQTKVWNSVLTLAPGESIANFKMYPSPMGTHESEWNVVFYNQADDTQSASLNIKYSDPALISCTPTSTNDFDYEIGKAFPNPATDQINIAYQIDANDAQLNIYNALGMRVESIAVSAQSESVTVDVVNYTNGVYFYQVTDGKSQSKMLSFVK